MSIISEIKRIAKIEITDVGRERERRSGPLLGEDESGENCRE